MVMSSIDISSSVGSLRLANPIIPASGTFGFGAEAAGIYDINRLGAVVMKGVTREPRYGNPLPRVTDCPSGMLNAVGLENPGIDAVLAHDIPKLSSVYSGPIIANVCGFTIGEYADLASRLGELDAIAALEINISCPNVSHGGMSFGTDASCAAEVTRAVRRVTAKPVWMKLSPNVSSIADIAKACEDEGADAISLINTLLGMRISIHTRRPILGNVMGGLSGPCVLPIAVRMVYQVSRAVKIPVIGMGGISSAEDVMEMTLAGACAVQIGTAGLVDPYALINILDDLPRVIERLRGNSYSEMIGYARQP